VHRGQLAGALLGRKRRWQGSGARRAGDAQQGSGARRAGGAQGNFCSTHWTLPLRKKEEVGAHAARLLCLKFVVVVGVLHVLADVAERSKRQVSLCVLARSRALTALATSSFFFVFFFCGGGGAQLVGTSRLADTLAAAAAGAEQRSGLALAVVVALGGGGVAGAKMLAMSMLTPSPPRAALPRGQDLLPQPATAPPSTGAARPQAQFRCTISPCSR